MSEVTDPPVIQKKQELTPSTKARIEANRQKAMFLRRSKLVSHPYSKGDNAASVTSSVIKVSGSKFIDSGGGFLVEETTFKEATSKPKEYKKIINVGEELPIQTTECRECSKEFVGSYLLDNFDYCVCDNCHDRDEKHELITKTEAKDEFLLKDCDFDRREPNLRFVSKKNPHYKRGEMKLYLKLQVYKRAMEVWGSEEELERLKGEREVKKDAAKVKRFDKKLKELKMNMRSSVFTKNVAASHQHEFGEDTYHEEEDNYSHTCSICGFFETFEKM